MAETLRPGEVLGRDFKVIRRLAAGGMGTVYEAVQLSTGKRRALKVMHAQYEGDERTRQRFVQEARATAAVDSDHIVEMVAAGVDETRNAPWIVMELLQGEDLKTALHARGRFDWADCLEIFAQLGHALAAAHAMGLVHRDLKPENIFLATPRRAGVPFTVKVLDFGLAKLVQESSTNGNGTQAVGSPRWMAPEQTQSDGQITPATDVWALGLLAFTLLTGQVYWKTAHAAAPSIMQQMCELLMDPLEPASTRAASYNAEGALPEGFDEWFDRCVDRDPARRFPEAGAAVESLLALLRQSPVAPLPLARPTSRPSATPSSVGLEIPLPEASGQSLAALNLEIPRDTPAAPSTVDPVSAQFAPVSKGPRTASLVAIGLVGTVAVVGGVSFLLRTPDAPVAPTPSSASVARPESAPTPTPTPTEVTPDAGPSEMTFAPSEVAADAGAVAEPTPEPPTPARAPTPAPVANANARARQAPSPNANARAANPRPTQAAAQNPAQAEPPNPEDDPTAAVDSRVNLRELQQRVNSRMGARQIDFLACYERHTDPANAVAGTLTLTFNVNGEGRATGITTRGLPNAPEVGRCVADVVRGIEFGEAPPGGVPGFIHTFRFAPRAPAPRPAAPSAPAAPSGESPAAGNPTGG